MSNMAPLPNPLRQFLRVVEKVERREIVRAADIVFPSLAGAEENAATVAHRGLGCLHIEAIGVQGDFAGDGDAGRVRSQVVGSRPQAERRCEAAELRTRAAVKEPLGIRVVGDRLAEVEGRGSCWA